MSTNPTLLLPQVVAAIDASSDPEASFTAMIVFLMSATKKLNLDQAWVAFSNASNILDGLAPYRENPEDWVDEPVAVRGRKKKGAQ
jgi:hypothetical protein